MTPVREPSVRTKPAGRLPTQDWMTCPDTTAVVKALTAEGAEVRFVGGCVRDAVKGFAVKDIDLATPDPPERVVQLLKAARLKAVPTGIDHGTVTAVSGGRPFEITTLREDTEHDGRWATVVFTDDWIQDAARRDLTINALSCRPDGTLFDPFGGLDDLETGQVRFVGDPAQRIEEDYLRLLRFFRFHAHYGHGAPDPAGLAAARSHASGLARLSAERVRDELLRLLLAPDPAPVLDSMAEARILSVVLPEAGDRDTLRAVMTVEERPDALLRFAALIVADEQQARQVAERLRLSRAETERLGRLKAESPPPPRIETGARALRQILYEVGAETTGELLRLDWARRQAAGGQPDRAHLTEALQEVAQWVPRVFPLRGRDAIALGASPGPAMGDALTRVETWWREADFEPDRDACLLRLQEELSG